VQTLPRAARISRIPEQFFSVQHFKKSERISRRGAFGVIVEIDVHGAVLFEPTPDTGYPFSERRLGVAGCIFPRVTVQSDVNEIGCHFVPHWPVGRVGDAEGDTVILKAFGDLIVEPRFVTELDGVSRPFPAGQNFRKSFQPPDILFQRRGKLPDHSGKLFAQRRGGITAANHRFFNVEQLLVVRDIAVAFDGERKSLRRFVAPALEGSFLRQLVEGAVNLDAGKTFGAKPQPFFLRRVAIETVAPAFVIPAAGADICFAGHRKLALYFLNSSPCLFAAS